MNLLRIRNSSVRLRALLLPAVALALAGGAVSAPAASASIKPACGWQNLELVNGWVSANTGTSNTGDPMYCVAADGSVYLAGSITHTPGASAEFALLPPQALPPTTQGYNVFTNGNTTGALAIAPTGEMYVVDITGAAGSAAQYTSLDGMSFPATESNLPINPLTPQNGWNVGAGGAPGYYLTGGVVHLTGSVTTTGLPNHSPLATLPACGQPTACTIANVFSNGGSPGTVQINPAGEGQIFAYNASNSTNALTLLDGIAFPAAGAQWTPLMLSSNWQPWKCETELPSVVVINHVVYLNGGGSSRARAPT